MKKIVWETPNKMHFESAYKTFNKQVNIISTGNVGSNTQLSFFIRPYKETECNGFTRKPGVLMEFDLRAFKNLPAAVKEIVCDKEREGSIILYEFRTWSKGRKDVFAYVITDYDYNYITSCVLLSHGQSYMKRNDALLKILPYICTEESIADMYLD